MIDLFNKRKLKKLQSQLNYNENYMEKLNGELGAYKKLYKEKCEEENKSINNLLEENQKLINWIYKILDNFGQISNSEIDYIRIPYTKSMTHKAYTDTKTICIRVPELILYKEERMKQ